MPPKTDPQRTCTGCGKKKSKGEMIRIVADPSGKIVPDLKGRLPARGAYICPERVCIERAAAGRLAASLKHKSLSPVNAEELSIMVRDMYSSKVLALLGMARKGGSIVSGANLVEGELRRKSDKNWIGLLAVDASEGSISGIMRKMEAAGIRVERFSSRDQIGHAIGKSQRSVVLVKDSGIAAGIVDALSRYRNVANKGGFVS